MIYSHLQEQGQTRRKSKSLSHICEQLLGISLSKELQCSDWSQRPLTQDQITYAALDALCLIHIFNVFQQKQGSVTEVDSSSLNVGLKQILNISSKILVLRSTAVEVARATITENPQMLHLPRRDIIPIPMDYELSQIVRKYGDKIVLTESKKKGKRKVKVKGQGYDDEEWQGPPPWVGGDGCPKFLCDVMVEGLAKYIRCVGIDAAVPHSRKPETRELIDQAMKEKRVVLTRDAKLMRHGYLLKNQIYRVKSVVKNEQLVEVIERFELQICEAQLMSRCTKCNGRFIQKPLSMEEAVEAAKGFQVIPSCLFDRNIDFWQCTDCHQLYWEGTQYRNIITQSRSSFMSVRLAAPLINSSLVSHLSEFLLFCICL